MVFVNPLRLEHYTKIRILNITLNSTSKTILDSDINASIDYNCSIPSGSIQPFIYQNSPTIGSAGIDMFAVHAFAFIEK